MEENFLISILGKQMVDGKKGEIELTTRGSYVDKGHCRYISYREYDEDNPHAKILSSLKVEGDNKVTLIRTGSLNSRLVLEKGQDDASIAKIATMLRSVVVTTPAKIVDGRVNPDMPSGLFTIEIDFTTGVHYQIIGYSPGDNSFSIYTSDLDESMLYTADGESVTALRQLIDNQR